MLYRLTSKKKQLLRQNNNYLTSILHIGATVILHLRSRPSKNEHSEDFLTRRTQIGGREKPKQHTTTLILATLFSLELFSFSFVGNTTKASPSVWPLWCRLLITSKSLSNALVTAGIKGDGSNGSVITCWKENWSDYCYKW